MRENFETWVRTVTGPIEVGEARVFDERISNCYEDLRAHCENGKWIPNAVTQSFSTLIHSPGNYMCVMVITAQLVSQEYIESQRRMQAFDPRNGSSR